MNEQNTLPQNPVSAVTHVTMLAKKLIEVMEQESKALAVKDSVAFTAAQEEKERLSASYQRCAQEFQQRLMDFRDVDKTLLDNLNQAQLDLKSKTQENSAAMERMQG